MQSGSAKSNIGEPSYFGVTTHSTSIFSIMTLSITTLSIMGFSTTILSITSLIVLLSIMLSYVSLHKVSHFCNDMLSVVLPSVVTLSVAAP